MRMTTRDAGQRGVGGDRAGSPRGRRVPGIRMSISTTSGRCSRASAHRLGAVGRLADHLDVGLARRAARGSPPRTSAWSSASTTGSRVDRPAAGIRPRRGSRRPAAAASRARPPSAAARSRMPMMPVARPGTADRAAPSPSSSTGHRERVVAVVERAPSRGSRAGVPDDVGERLLHDPVGGELDRRRAARGPRPVAVVRTVEPGRGRCGRPGRRASGEAGGRTQRRGLVVARAARRAAERSSPQRLLAARP